MRLGFNYALIGEANQEAEERERQERAHSSPRSDWDVKEVKVGGELYGGLGDSTRRGRHLTPMSLSSMRSSI